ncbi:MAG: ribosome maturation factor RimM [Lachnospiraceae bacterium]|nr:ribosome maturation factor RimM [Lachnospiraceae bacterium]
MQDLDLFRVGVIANTHGVKGEVKIFPTTDAPERFKKLKSVILDAKREKITLEIQSARFFKNLVIVKFKGIDNINDIEKYKGCDLYVTRENATPLDEGEYYIADLIDMKVVDEENKELGVLFDVMQTGANDVFVVKLKDSDKELLLPNIPDCVLDVDLESRVITVHVLDGLMDM